MIAYWKFAVGAMAGFLLAWTLQNWNIESLKRSHAQKLAAQVIFDIKQCSEAKTVTKDDNEHYQKLLADRDADIARLSKRPTRCLYISRPADSTQSGQLQQSEGSGLPDSVLYKFASFCETDRAGLETLQRHNEKVQCKLKTGENK